jgi:hypothetical protein
MFWDQEAAILYDRAVPRADLPDVSPLLKSRLELIYHTTFGELARAHAAADAHVAAASAEQPHARAQALRFASYAYRRVARHDLAFAALEEAYSSSAANQDLAAAAATAVHLSIAALEVVETARAESWYEKALALRTEIHDRVLPLDLIGIATRFAIERGDAQAARGVISVFDKRLLRDEIRRRRSYALGVYVLASIAAGARVQPTLVRDLRDLHFVARSLGGQDLSTVALAVALSRDKKRDEAEALWHEYVAHHRREKSSAYRPALLGEIGIRQLRCAHCDRREESAGAEC